MSIKQNADYPEERKRLKYTKELIEDTIEKIEFNKEKYRGDMKQAMLDLDYLDSSQSYITILTTSQFMRMDQAAYEKLLRARKKPYFSRIDFKEENSNVKKYYIGKLSLTKEIDQDPIIIDWRAPIANVYYEGRLGDISYESPMGKVAGTLLLKRQFTIEDGQLENFIDIDITTNDTFLQASLEAHADNRLKDIAATIQGEQNRVIRSDINRPLIVQGVAGSGKTTIALHRIAYLIYTYQDRFIPENFVILAPNRLFINYVSEVLPELGVERIKQITYADLIFELIGHKYKLKNPNDKLVYFLEHKNEEHGVCKELLRKASEFKGSLLFKKLIDNYLRHLEKDFVPKEDFVLEGFAIYAQDDIQRLFLEEYSFMPLYKRVDLIKKVLSSKLKNIKPKILMSIEEKCFMEMDGLRNTMDDSEERRLKLLALMETRDKKLKIITNGAKTLTAKYIRKFPKVELLAFYKDIITREESIINNSPTALDHEFVQFLCEHSASLLDQKHVEFEDLAPLVYLQHRIFGFKEKIEINHVVIDEAQDFSLFQFYSLKTVLNTSQFTILGDLSQSIHGYRGIKDWQDVIEQIFGKDKGKYLTLTQSYRTTIEIMSVANQIIKQLEQPNQVLAEPVIRHGEKPQRRDFHCVSEVLQALKVELGTLQGSEYKSFAIICKSLSECQMIKNDLHMSGVEAEILNGEENSYSGGIVILPCYVAKGLEFDVVFIVNIDEEYTKNVIDIKLLYVAMTRALHLQYIYYLKGKMSLFDKIDCSFFK